MSSTASTSPRYSRILGTGSYLPADRVTNQALAERLAADGIETADEIGRAHV